VTPLLLLESARDELITARRAAEVFGWTDDELARIDLLIRAVKRTMSLHSGGLSQLSPSLAWGEDVPAPQPAHRNPQAAVLEPASPRDRS
jgi:hypothetical protein